MLVHETDAERDGCAFDTFFKTTPQDLIDGGLYDTLAELFVSGEAHRKLSYALLAKKLGAEAPRSVGRRRPSMGSLSWLPGSGAPAPAPAPARSNAGVELEQAQTRAMAASAAFQRA